MRSPNENNRARQNQQNNRRGRNNNRRNNNNNSNNSGKPQNMLTKSFDSNGPDVKIRGNAQTIAEKYTSLAHDAISSGSRIIAENYFQHAEHYKRIVSIAQEQQAEQKAAHQAKMDAQQAEQKARREQQAAQHSHSNQAEANQAQTNQADNEQPSHQQMADAPKPEPTPNAYAPVSILDNNDPAQPAEQPSPAPSEPIQDQDQPIVAEEKPKRKRIVRPKRKPNIAKTQAVEPASSEAAPSEPAPVPADAPTPSE